MYKRKDHFHKKAKSSGLRARSAFKIDEIAQKFQLLKSGLAVLDLGCWPGGFMQVVRAKVGAKGRVFGVDLMLSDPLPYDNVKAIAGDVFEESWLAEARQFSPSGYDGVFSDLAPNTTGIHLTDHMRSVELVERALHIADQLGKPGSAFVAKLFMGGEIDSLRKLIRTRYAKEKLFRPESTRSESKEVFLIGEGRKAPTE